MVRKEELIKESDYKGQTHNIIIYKDEYTTVSRVIRPIIIVPEFYKITIQIWDDTYQFTVPIKNLKDDIQSMEIGEEKKEDD